MKIRRRILATAFSLVFAPAAVWGQSLRISFGTLAPDGSPWHLAFQRIDQEWRKISSGSVTLRIFPGGVLGDEGEMLRKVKIGQIQAVALSGAGLAFAEPEVMALQIPMMYESYAELDYVRAYIEPRLEALLAEHGFIVVQWGDVGWVHFFSKTPARTPDDFRRLKLWITPGDPEAEKIYKDLRFNPVPVATTEMLTQLKTGYIDAFDVPPAFALADQSFALAPYMMDLKWAPLVGATLVSRKTWEKIPQHLRPALLQAARDAGDRLRAEARKFGDDAIAEMRKRSLKVMELSGEERAAWTRLMEGAYPSFRGKLVSAQMFDEVKRLRDEFRANHAGKQLSRGAAR
jgi:TRAP-type C4-dicarboxylate transport system substrate-binding protein